MVLDFIIIYDRLSCLCLICIIISPTLPYFSGSVGILYSFEREREKGIDHVFQIILGYEKKILVTYIKRSNENERLFSQIIKV